MDKLRKQLKDDMELKGFVLHTQRSYLMHVNQFIRHFGKSPRQLGEKEIKAYFLYLLREKKSAAATVNQCYHALKFLYETTLNRDRVMARISRLKSIKQLPVVLCLFRPIRPPIPIQSGHLSERSDAGFSLYLQVAGMSQG